MQSEQQIPHFQVSPGSYSLRLPSPITFCAPPIIIIHFLKTSRLDESAAGSDSSSSETASCLLYFTCALQKSFPAILQLTGSCQVNKTLRH